VEATVAKLSWHRVLSRLAFFAVALLICGIADAEHAHAQEAARTAARKLIEALGSDAFKLRLLWIRASAATSAYGAAQFCGTPDEAETKSAAEEANKQLDKAIDDYNWEHSADLKAAVGDAKAAGQRALHDYRYYQNIDNAPYVQDALRKVKDVRARERDRVRELLAQGQPISYFRAAGECHEYLAGWAGLHAGGGIGVQNTIGNDWTTTEIISLGSHDFVPDDNSGSFTTGFRVSTYAGYDWIIAPRWLAGIEGDVGYSTNNKTAGIPGVSSAPGDSLSMQENWDASLRARLGYLVAPQVLLYGTAGATWQHFSATVMCTSATPFPCGRFGPVAPMTATTSATPIGWTIGAGLEYALTGRLKLRGEYRYADYGTVNAAFGTPANLAIGSAIHMQTQTATLGLTYAFGGPWMPPAAPLVTK
jgi:opacity protein-like surface antigen